MPLSPKNYQPISFRWVASKKNPVQEPGLRSGHIQCGTHALSAKSRNLKSGKVLSARVIARFIPVEMRASVHQTGLIQQDPEGPSDE
jgi:hypothetical protein